MLSVFPYCSSSYCLETGSLPELEAHCLVLGDGGVTAMCSYAQGFSGCEGCEFRSLCLQDKSSCSLSHLPQTPLQTSFYSLMCFSFP